jgi:hypothetical protein
MSVATGDELEKRKAAGRGLAKIRWAKTARLIPPGGTKRVEVPLLPGETPYQAAARWLRENDPKAGEL